MATTSIVPRIKASSSRRKRSRAEFDAENIDVMAIGTVTSDQPRKKARTMTADQTRSITTALSFNPRNLTHTSTTAAPNTKKRAYSQTEFSFNYANDEVLKECSPNKKAKTQHTIKMMIDNESDGDIGNEHKEESQDVKPSEMELRDEEGDVSMQPIRKKKRITRRVRIPSSVLSFLSSHRRRNRDKFPPNRVRRSGLQLCVECGIGVLN